MNLIKKKSGIISLLCKSLFPIFWRIHNWCKFTHLLGWVKSHQNIISTFSFRSQYFISKHKESSLENFLIFLFMDIHPFAIIVTSILNFDFNRIKRRRKRRKTRNQQRQRRQSMRRKNLKINRWVNKSHVLFLSEDWEIVGL